MKNLIKITLIATTLALSTSCEKEIAIPKNHYTENQSLNQITDLSKSTLAYATPVTYYACGMTVNVFSPNEYLNKKYSFAISSNGQIKRFGLGLGSEVNYDTPDNFIFEFAGYADKSLTAKTWRIKRTDGLYLTSHNGSLFYASKLIGTQEAAQIFMLSSLGNNVYKILNPKMPKCRIAAIYYDSVEDVPGFFASFEYDYQLDNRYNTNIIMVAIDQIITK